MNIYNNVQRACTFALLLLIAHLAGAQELLKVANWDKESGWIYMKSEQKIIPKTFFEVFGKDLGLDTDNQMRIYKETEDKVKQKHYQFEQLYKGILVENALMTVHTQNGYVEKVNGNVVAGIQQDISPSQSSESALKSALQYLGTKQYIWLTTKDTVIRNARKQMPTLPTTAPKGELVLALRDNGKKFENDNLALAYRFTIYFFEEGYAINGYHVYVDANTGKVLKSNMLGHNCGAPQSACTGQSRYANPSDVETREQGDGFWYPTYYWEPHWQWVPPTWFTPGFWIGAWVFGGWQWAWIWHYWDLHDDCQGDKITTVDQWLLPVTNNGNGWSCNSKQYTTAHWAAKKTYEYYLSEHGRAGFANTGNTDLLIRLQPGWNNAMATPLPFSAGMLNVGYGNNHTFSSLDVLGHEYTHLVTCSSVGNLGIGLIYAGESGALNESFSDIFGTMTEFHTLGNNGNYYHNEDYDYNPSPGTLTRDLSEPGNYGDPNTYHGLGWEPTNCGIPIPAPLPGANDMCGVHSNSGVQNYWFYLLAEGGSGQNNHGNNYCVQGIGKDKAAAIAYYNLTVSLSSMPLATYADARTGAINAAIALYGVNSFEAQQTAAAWYAVGVYGSNAVTFNTSNAFLCANGTATLSGTITGATTAPYTITLYNIAGIQVAPSTTSNLPNYSFNFSPSISGDYYIIVHDNAGHTIYYEKCPIHIDIFNNSSISIDAYSTGATNCLDDNMQIDGVVNGGMNPLTYSWNLNNQTYSTASIQSNLVAGTYPADLTVTTANGCTATTSSNVVVDPYFCGNPAFYPTVNGNLISLNAVDNVAMATWDVYDSNTNTYIGSYPLDSISLHLAGGDYLIYHFMYDCNTNFCNYTYQYITTCDPLQVSITGNTPICAGTATTYTANVTGGNGSYTYAWNVAGQTGNSITVSPTVNKTYTVYVTSPHSCATVSATIDVIVNPLPVVTITGPTTFCAGGTAHLTANCSTAVSYQWYYGQNLITGATSVNYIPQQTGLHKVVVTDANGCSKHATYSVTVSASPPANAGADKTVCAGSKTKIGVVGNTAYTYTWSPTNGLATPLKDTSSCITSVNRTYILTVTNPSTGCSRKDTMNVIANPLPATPIVTLNGTNPTCAGAGTTLSTAAGLTSYQWYLGPTAISSNATNNTYTPTISGNHRVVVTNTNGCSKSSANYPIIVYPAPPANAGADKTICAGSPVSIGTVTNSAYTYSWSPGLGLSDSLIANPQAFPMDTTQYVLTVTNKISLCSKKDTIKVITKPLPPTPMLAITTPALPGEDSIVFCEGATNVVLSGTAPGFSTFYWHKNGTYYGAGATSMVSNQALSVVGDNFTLKTKGANTCYSMPSNPIFVQKLAAPQPIISPAGTNNVIALCGYGTNIGTDTLTASVPANAPSVYSYEWQNAVSGVYVPATNAFSFPLNDSLPVSVTGTQIKYYRVVVSYENTCQRTSVVKRLEKSTNCKESIGRNGDEVIIDMTENKMTVFPNPTQDILHIELIGKLLDNGTLSLINTLGQVIMTQEVHFEQDNMQLEWDLSALVAGIYSLSFSTKNGQEVLKIVKE